MSKRILDETTASTFASDDYLYMDGSTNGSRKITPDNLVANASAVTTLASGLSTVNTNIDTINSDIDALVSSVADTNSSIGSLTDLETTDTSSIVNAINEVASSGGGGSIDTLSDVSLSSLSDNQLLAYDSSDALWKNVTVSGDGVTVDSAMSSTSTNPVQNAVIYSALADKQDVLDKGIISSDSSATIDFDDITSSGIWYITSTLIPNALNKPWSDVSSYACILSVEVAGTRIKQTVTRYGVNQLLAHRTSSDSGSTWNDWAYPLISGLDSYVTSVNGSTGAVTIANATTSAAGLMSADDKSHLNTVYADYSSAITALGV